MILESVQIGRARPSAVGSLPETAIDKRPTGSATITEAGLTGDTIVDTKNHGGPDQAVYIYTREDFAHWEAELGRPLAAGTFGENLTLAGISSAEVKVGDRFLIGDVVLEASSARIPCAVFQDHIGEAEWIARFRDARRPGVYCRVLGEGTVAAGDEVHHVPGTSLLTILDTQDIYYDREFPSDRLEAALEAPIGERNRTLIERRLGRRYRL